MALWVRGRKKMIPRRRLLPGHPVHPARCRAPYEEEEDQEADVEDAGDGVRLLQDVRVVQIVHVHQHGVVGAVQGDGDKVREGEVFAAHVVAEPGKGEEIAHEDGEEEVCGHGEEAASDSKSQSALHDVEHVLDACEAESHEGRILQPVVVFVEVGALPDAEVEHQQLAELLGERRAHKSVVQGVGQWRVRRLGDEEVQDEHVEHRGQHAESEGFQQQRPRLLLERVAFVNVAHQQGNGKQGGNEDDGHRGVWVMG